MKIVAPAGNMERFYAAVKAGAQEIYMGLKGFGAVSYTHLTLPTILLV